MRTLITGSAGMLGSALVPELVRRGHAVAATDVDVDVAQPWGLDGPSLSMLDVRDRVAVDRAVDQIRPDIVFHLAAETSLEVCETDELGAFATNAIGTKHMALACQRHEIPLVHISTAGVFDGTQARPYTEFDEPNPINVYGRTKVHSERLVQSLLTKYYIVRAGWMVGGGPGKDHKFVSYILSQLDAGETTLHAVVDKLGTPTYARDFSAGLADLVTTDSYGLYHMCGHGEASRYQVAEYILGVLNRPDVELVPVDSGYFAEEFFAPRPRSETMRNLVLELQGMDRMRHWQAALSDYMHRHFPDRIHTDEIDLRTESPNALAT